MSPTSPTPPTSPTTPTKSSPQIIALLNAFQNIKIIETKLAASHLTETIFSTNGYLPDQSLDNARGAVAIEFQFFVRNIRSVKGHDALVKANPDIHYNLTDQVARRNWIVHEYLTSAPVKWNEIAKSIYHDIPRIKQAIVTVVGASYLED